MKLIFFLYLYGYSTGQIATALMELQRLTKKGNSKWTQGTVLNVLQNERHCGDVLAHKTWTPSYLDHKSKKNRMNRNQYLYHDDHEAIVSRDDFIAAQHLIANAKYGHRGLLPKLHVIETGALKGFVAINTKWSGFTEEDYFEAARSVKPDLPDESILQRQAQPGDFDYRGFVVARSQFIQSQCDVSVTFSTGSMQFSKGCIEKLNQVQRVELLLDPIHWVLAVRTSNAENRHSVAWMKPSDKNPVPKPISGTAFLPTFYQMFHWKTQDKYRARGIRHRKDNETILLFSLKDTEIIIPILPEQPMFDEGTTPVSASSRSNCIAYPAEWMNSFGTDVYEHEMAQELIPMERLNEGNLQAPGTPVEGKLKLKPTGKNELRNEIDSLIHSMKREETVHG